MWKWIELKHFVVRAQTSAELISLSIICAKFWGAKFNGMLVGVSNEVMRNAASWTSAIYHENWKIVHSTVHSTNIVFFDVLIFKAGCMNICDFVSFDCQFLVRNFAEDNFRSSAKFLTFSNSMKSNQRNSMNHYFLTLWYDNRFKGSSDKG